MLHEISGTTDKRKVWKLDDGKFSLFIFVKYESCVCVGDRESKTPRQRFLSSKA